ncbi:MAG TPA: hypothetical protein VKG43_02795 [Acidimicrobiales bacterium]|nr:hypothetical protein [Acidimicrobiales bacterium]
MNDRKWIDPSQPQTLQAAVIFCYINAVLAVIYALAGISPSLLLLALAVAAFFIANERRWAYWVAVVIAVVYMVLQLVAFVTFSHSLFGVLPLLFSIVLVVLLLHPQSREYQKIWFH